MGIVPSPGEDQVPLAPGFRAGHPDIEIAGPPGRAWACGRLTGAAMILVVKLDMCQRPGRPGELLVSGQAATTSAVPVPK